MDMKQLEYFVAIAEEGNLTAAAKKLLISQPPLSYQMKMLEEELGVVLLERGSRRTTLTDAGRALYTRAKTLLDLADVTKRELQDMGRGLRGTLSLGTVSSSGYALLSKRMVEFHNRYPNINFDVHDKNTFQLIEMIKNGVLELAIVRTPFPSEGLEYLKLSPEPMVAVGTKEHMAAFSHLETLRLLDLANTPIIHYKRFERLILAVYHKYDLEPNFLCKNEDARTTLLWAAAGLGVGIVPQSITGVFGSNNIETKVIEEKELYTQIAAVWKEKHYLSSVAQSFLEVFAQEEGKV